MPESRNSWAPGVDTVQRRVIDRIRQCNSVRAELAPIDGVGDLRLGYTVSGTPVPLNRLFAVVDLGQITVVAATHEMDILQAVVAATSIGLTVVELEPVAVSATPAVLINEGTLSPISFANGPPDCS